MRGCNAQVVADIESLVTLMTPFLWQLFYAWAAEERGLLLLLFLHATWLCNVMPLSDER